MMTEDANVTAILEQYYPASALRCMKNSGTKFFVLSASTKFCEVSPVLRQVAPGIDGWPIPPAGLFVVEERTVYLRSMSPMTICHEAGHALDCALGDGVYRSSIEPKIRRAFAAATAFVTPYAASSCDEYFAEAVRAWVGANDPHSLWPAVSRERLARVDTNMCEIVSGLFAEIEARFCAPSGEQLAMEFAS
jgi:hypothetical protein